MSVQSITSMFVYLMCIPPMRNYYFKTINLLLLTILLLLTACSFSVYQHEGLMLSERMTANSTLFPLQHKPIMWRDKDYNVSFGDYQIKDMDSSFFNSTNTTDLDSDLFTFNVEALFHSQPWWVATDTKKQQSNAHFSFSLYQNNEATSLQATGGLHSKCQTQSIVIKTTKTAIFNPDDKVERKEREVFSGLNCLLGTDVGSQKGQQWQLQLIKPLGETVINLTSPDHTYTARLEYQTSGQRHTVGRQNSQFVVKRRNTASGVRIFRDNTEVAVLSLLDDKYIRVTNDLPRDEVEHLLTALYSIAVFSNKASDNWRFQSVPKPYHFNGKAI